MSTGAKIGAWFAVGLVIIAAVGGSAYVSMRHLIEEERWVAHTYEVKQGLEHVLLALTDAETGQRGFVLIGKEQYLEPYNAAVGEIERDIDALAELTRDNAAQQQSLKQVRKLVDAKLAELRETIALRRKSGLEPALAVVRSDRGQKIMDELRGVIAEMENREQRLLEKRKDEAAASADRTISTIALWMPIGLLALAVAAVVLMRSVRFGGPAARPGTPGKKWGRVAAEYVSAVIIVAVAVMLKIRLTDSFGDLPTFVTLYPAVLLAASIGGGGPGIVATVLAALAADYYFIPPYGSLHVDAPNDMLALGIFTGTSLFLSLLAERLRRARWAEAVSVTQEQQLEELSRLNEELSQQSEELSQQSEELAQQNEEMQAQSEEIHALNSELTYREGVLQKLLEAARLSASEQAVMQEICAAAKEMFGPAASAVLVLEPHDSRLLVRGQAGLGPEGAKLESLPSTNCFAELVIAENKTAALADASLRPDLSLFRIPGEPPFQAILAAPMRSDGRPFGVVGIYSHQKQEWTAEQFRLAEWLAAQCTHILETLRLQAELRRLYAEQQTIFNSVPAMIWYKDTKNNFVRVNRAVALSVGKPLEAIEGKSAYEVFPDEAERYYRDDLEVINSGQPKLGIIEEMGTASGAKRWVQTDKIPYRDERGEIIGVLVLSVDVTERKRAEEALVQATVAAEAANVAKTQFLANMSHELRTPMNAILGMIDVALPKAIDPVVLDCLRTAKGSGDLLLTLLNDLLDSAKIESGKLELESAPFSLRRMLDQVTRVLSVRASENGLSFRCRVPDETPDAFVGDRMRLQQVLLNLAGNAIKFTERGEVEISLRALLEDGEACLEFAVRDTGIGISSAGQERLFQPFTQSDASMARRFGGTGLGLSICKSLVEMMGGRIWVESEEGKGSTFYFTVHLPLAKEIPADFEVPLALPAAALAQLRILLVEDNPANQILATYILQDRGHFVEVAEDGEEAVRLTEQNSYDVVLMDVQMPGMNGLEATALIRQQEAEKGLGIRDAEKGLGIGDWGLEDDKQPATSSPSRPIPNPQSPIPSHRAPIIAMTAHAMKGDRDRCLEAGMDGYLSKPIDAHEMIALVETLAAGSLSAAAGGIPSAPGAPQAAEPAPTPVFDAKLALKRRKAEQRLHTEKTRPALGVSDADAHALVHELQVYQIELEMQNEELRRAQAAAEEASHRYSNLFDFAPVAYFVWDHEARILEVNLRGAGLLGLDRGMVVNKRFGQFVAAEYHARFADFCHRVLLTDVKQSCEIKILKDGQAVDVMVEGIAVQDRQGQEKVCRAAVIDISQQKRIDELEAANAGADAATSIPTEPASPPDVGIFDPELALQQCLSKRDLLQDMIAIFFKDADKFLPQMRAALTKGELSEVGRLAHQLKGTLGHIAAEQARAAAERAEHFLLHTGEQAEAEEAVTTLERECAVLKPALAAYQAAANSMRSGR
jgi:PAS domain S-box-containing protein